MPLYEVAIIELPKKKEDEEILVFGPEFVIAQSDQQAAIRAVMENKSEINIDFKRMQVLVRPFV